MLTVMAATPKVSQNIKIASFVLTGVFGALTLWAGLLPGLLGACLGAILVKVMLKARFKGRALPGWVHATLVIATPLLALLVLALNVKGLSLAALSQYRELLEHLSTTVLDIRSKLPPELAKNLPEGVTAIQGWLAEFLREHASHMANTGKTWLHGTLLAYVGLIVGSLIALSNEQPAGGPLAVAMRERAIHFIEAFKQIVTAQFWIAAFNTALTAVFLLAVLPVFSVSLPYTGALLSFTFLAGLVPIVGNLMCNVVLTMVGVSVAPMVGLSCLLFLILIHKFEYFINAKVVGSKTQTAAWELLAVMFAAEAIIGVPGLIAGPLFYAYLKKELKKAKLV